MNFTSELKLQIQVTLRLFNVVHFLCRSHRNQTEFDAMSQLARAHYAPLKM